MPAPRTDLDAPDLTNEPASTGTFRGRGLSRLAVGGPAPRWSRWATALIALVVLVGLPAAQAAHAPQTDVAAPSGLTSLVGTAGPIPAGAVFIAPLAGASPIDINVEMNIPSTPSEQAFLQGVITPGSPDYHHYSYRGFSFVAEYGAPPTVANALKAYWGSYGLTVTPLDQLGLIYGLSGSASSFDAALHVTLWQVRSGSTVGYLPRSDPTLPSSLAPWVEAFHNLNSFNDPKPLYELDPAITAQGLTPQEIAGAYTATTLVSGGDTGSSYVVGLAEECDTNEPNSDYQSDVNTFDTSNSLPADTITLSGPGATSCTTGMTGWGLETDLDIQSSHTIAPGSKQDVCLQDTAADPSPCDSNFISSGIEFGSNSWAITTNSYASIWNTAEAAGVDLLASAGDCCAQCAEGTPGTQAYPASETYSIAVGGTLLATSGNSWSSESVWDTSCSTPGGGGEGGGGGCDSTVTPPSYEIGMTGYPGACATGDRGYPDVAADADPNSGLNIYSGDDSLYGCSTPCDVGGTSLACPIWAATLDLVYQYTGFTGFAGPDLYQIGKGSSYTSAFHDITSGSNGYSATTGWDPATGLGTPNDVNLVAAWNAPLAASLSPTTKTVETGQTVPLVATVTGGVKPLSYVWQQNGTPILGAPNGPLFNYTQFHAAASPYTITLQVTDSKSSMVTTNPASIQVNPGPTVAFTATPTAVEAGQTVALTAVAAGGTGTYTGYRWTLNGTQTIATTASGSYTWTAPNTTMDPTIGVVVTDSLGGAAVGSTPIQVYAHLGVAFSFTPAGPIDTLMPVALTLNATGGASPLTYTFLANGTTSLSSGTLSGSSSTYDWTPTGAGTYELSASLTDGLSYSTTSGSIPITVNPSPTVAVQPPTTNQIDVGQVVSLDAHTSGGTGPFTFQWSENGSKVTGATTGTFSFRGLGGSTVTFQVTATDKFGRSATSPSFSLIVNPLPTVTISGAGTILEGTTDTLTATVSGGTAPFSYIWSLDQTPVPNQATSTYPFSQGVTGTYTVEVQILDSAGNSNVAFKSINVTAPTPWYGQSLIPGTSALESWAIIGFVILLVIAALIAVVVGRKRKREAPPAEMMPYGGAAAGTGVAGIFGSAAQCHTCGETVLNGIPNCPRCGTPMGGAPPAGPYAAGPPAYDQGYAPPPPDLVMPGPPPGPPR